MAGQVVLGSFESFNLYALNQAHSTHPPRYMPPTGTPYMPPTGTPHKSQNQLVVYDITYLLVQPRTTVGTTEEIEWFSIKRTADPHSVPVRDISAKTQYSGASFSVLLQYAATKLASALQPTPTLCRHAPDSDTLMHSSQRQRSNIVLIYGIFNIGL